MLYHLFQYLQAQFDFPGKALMGYLSFRAILAAVIGMLIAFFAGKRIIRLLQRKQIGEEIRDLGLEGQMQKKGTPTMGGVIIVLAVLVSALLVCDLTNMYVILMLVTTLWCGALGFADDYIKVFKHNKQGLSERGKLIAQLGLGLVIALSMCLSQSIITDKVITTIPFVRPMNSITPGCRRSAASWACTAPGASTCCSSSSSSWAAPTGRTSRTAWTAWPRALPPSWASCWACWPT